MESVTCSPRSISESTVDRISKGLKGDEANSALNPKALKPGSVLIPGRRIDGGEGRRFVFQRMGKIRGWNGGSIADKQETSRGDDGGGG